MSDALPAEIAVKLALAIRLTDAYVTLDAAELSTWQAWTAAHNPTIAAPVPAVAPPTAGTHPDSPETSESSNWGGSVTTASVVTPRAYGRGPSTSPWFIFERWGAPCASTESSSPRCSPPRPIQRPRP